MTLAAQVAGLISAGCTVTMLALQLREKFKARKREREDDEE